MGRGRTFKHYVADRLQNGLYRYIKQYAESVPASELDLHSYSVPDFDEAEFVDITEIKFVSVSDLPEMAIAFDVVLEAEFSVKEVTRHHDKEDSCFQWFKLKCRGDLAKDLTDFEVMGIEIYDKKKPQPDPMSDELVPIIKKEKLDDVAADFLKRYYPEALETPTPVDPNILAERMGLEIHKQEIADDASIFGQIHFRDNEGIKAGTILVDPRAYFMRTLGSVNNTIVHECVHWDKHRKAFEFQRLLDDSISKISCQVAGGISDSRAEAVRFMEWQANALTPRILMPRQMFVKKAYEQFTHHLSNGVSFLDALEPVIDELAVFFGVSRLSAKIRMIDVDYKEAIGAFNYIDGRYIKPYSFEKGTLARNQTFTISAADAGILPLTDPEFAKTTAHGKYLYVDAHFVLNDPKYIEQNASGETVLTDYARGHMNECCLVFDVSCKTDRKDAQYSSECVLNRDINSPFELEIKFNNNYQNSSQTEQSEYLANVVRENMEMYSKLPNCHKACLEQVKDWRGVTYQVIADEIPMDERQVRRIFNGESNGSIEALVAICLILYLPPEISFHIIEKSPHTLSLAKNEHQWYRFALQYHHGKQLCEVKTFLSGQGVTL